MMEKICSTVNHQIVRHLDIRTGPIINERRWKSQNFKFTFFLVLTLLSVSSCLLWFFHVLSQLNPCPSP